MTAPEIWRLVPSVPGLLASSRGRVMVIPKMGTGQNANKQYGGIARTGTWDGNRFVLYWNGKNHKVARLVCEAFNGPAPEGKDVCMHIDENARNNVPTNLEWGTQKQNLNAPGFLEYCRSRIGENSPTIKARRRAA